MAARFERPFTIAIMALGGQGGGVLTKWLVDLAQSNGYLAQSTYVAGVAQRTGATVYCVELFPEDQVREAGHEPVFTTYPVPGDVDLVVAGEFAETGRAIQKGFVTPNITTLIASTHRVYSIVEKSALGDGIIDQAPVMEAASKAAKKFIAFDMAEKADKANSIISAVLLGAIAASGALPFERDAYEAAIRQDGRAVDSNLSGFNAGYAGAGQAASEPADGQDSAPIPLRIRDSRRPAAIAMPQAEGPNGEALLNRIKNELPDAVRPLAAHGALRALNYQDLAYANLYLDRLVGILELERGRPDQVQPFALTREVARQLALQMCYEDTIRVAEIKTSGERMTGVRRQLNVAPQQPAHVVEYFHPRFEELCDTLPRSLGRRLLASNKARRLLQPLIGRGRNITTTNLAGYFQLALLARLKRWRRGTYRFVTQTELVEDWLHRIHQAGDDYNLARAIAECIGIVKGYGDTYERGLHRYRKIMETTEKSGPDSGGARVKRLHQAALADEDGKVFKESLRAVEEF